METSPEELYTSNQQFIYYVLNKHTSYYDEDLVECAKLGLWKACKNFDPSRGCTFSTYAFRCILNEIQMEYRRRGKYSGKELSYDNIIVADDPTLTALDLMEDKDDYYAYYDTIDTLATTLNDEEKELLCLSQSYTQKQIADILHCSQASICRKLSLLKDKLRKTLYN